MIGRLMVLVVVVMVAAGGFALYSGLDFFEDISGADASEEESLYRSANLETALAALREEVGPRNRVDLKIEQRSLKANASAQSEATCSLWSPPTATSSTPRPEPAPRMRPGCER